MLPIVRVLLADPDAAARSALSLLFKSKLDLQYIEVALDGEALAHSLAECMPDLLLLDWSLPGRPPGAALEQLQADNPRLRLVILSVDAAISAQAEALGAVFIHKGSAAEQALDQLRALVAPEA